MFIEIMAVEKHHKYVGLPTIISNSKTQGLPKSKNLKPKFLNLLKKESGRMKLIKMMEGESVIKMIKLCFLDFITLIYLHCNNKTIGSY